MKNVITRSLTGIVYIGLIVGAILGGNLYMLGLTLLFTGLAIDEFNRISDRHTLPLGLRILDIIGAMLPVTAAGLINGMFTMGFSIICLIIYFILYMMARLIIPLYIKKGDYLAQTAHSLMGQFYIVLPLTCLMVLYHISSSIVMLMFIMIWLNDTGAFCVGSLLGRHRLFERISPKKSWEGFFGGLIFAALAGVAAYYIYYIGVCASHCFESFSLPVLVGLGITVSIFATWGDLVESLIKRTLGIKDSGNLLPGHGGILDRIDSLLLVAPATLLYIFTFGTIF